MTRGASREASGAALEAVLEAHDSNHPPAHERNELVDAFNVVDENGDGTIDFDEFLAMQSDYVRYLYSVEQFKQWFDEADEDVLLAFELYGGHTVIGRARHVAFVWFPLMAGKSAHKPATSPRMAQQFCRACCIVRVDSPGVAEWFGLVQEWFSIV